MTEATLVWSIWQDLLTPFAPCFTQRGFPRFAEWITAMAINVEEHTVTQSVLTLDRPDDWKAMERFAEHGRWRSDSVTSRLTRLIENAPGRLWYGYHVSTVDDTKVHRSGAGVWEKVAGGGVDYMVGSPEDIQAVKDSKKPAKKHDLDA